jgi:hypothetical protein
MKKVSVLKHKIIRAYKNPKNWEYSKFKGYPEGTYFGYSSLSELIKSEVKKYVAFYGKGLKKWRYD